MTDIELIDKFEQYIKQNWERLKNQRILYEGNKLSFKDILGEMRRGTKFGQAYLRSLREMFDDGAQPQNRKIV